MDEVLKMIGPGNLNQVISEANKNDVRKGDIVDIIELPNGFVLIYFG